MVRVRRWSLVGVLLALLVALPFAGRLIPTSAPDPSAAAVVAQIRRAASDGYSGTVELSGSLQLPVTSRFTDVGALLGGRTTLRVWWRDANAWRIDKLLVAGETDLIHRGGRTTEWSFERTRATITRDPAVRLPRTSDLIPPVFAARFVADTGARSAVRLPTRRIAGIGAVGVRIRPAAEQSSISRADLWADPVSGTVLELQVYAAGSRDPAFTSVFTSYARGTPSVRSVAFTPPPGTDVRFDNVLDLADAANQYARVRPPAAVAGLRRADAGLGGVGVYGSGVTRLLAIPLRRHDTGKLADQVRASPGVVATTYGPLLMAGPLGVLVTDSGGQGWLVVGTVSRATLVRAGHDLMVGARFR